MERPREGSGGFDEKGRGFRWAGRTEPHFSPRAPKLRARERIERASIIFSGGALFLAVERASSLSRAEAASHGPSVMACRDPAPAQTPRYRGASAHAVHAAADSRNPPGVGLSRQVPAVHLSPSLSIQMVASVLRFCTRVQLTGRMHALYEWV